MLRFLEKHQRFVYKIFICYFAFFGLMGNCYADVSESQLYGDHYKKEEANRDNVQTDYYAPVKVKEGSYTQEELSAIDTAMPGADSNIVTPDGSNVQNGTHIGNFDQKKLTYIRDYLKNPNEDITITDEDKQKGISSCETYLSNLIKDQPLPKDHILNTEDGIKQVCSVLGTKLAKCAASLKAQAEKDKIAFDEASAYQECNHIINAEDIENINNTDGIDDNVMLETAFIDDLSCLTGISFLSFGQKCSDASGWEAITKSHTWKFITENPLDTVLTLSTYLLPGAGLLARGAITAAKSTKIARFAPKLANTITNSSKINKASQWGKWGKGEKSWLNQTSNELSRTTDYAEAEKIVNANKKISKDFDYVKIVDKNKQAIQKAENATLAEKYAYYDGKILYSEIGNDAKRILESNQKQVRKALTKDRGRLNKLDNIADYNHKEFAYWGAVHTGVFVENEVVEDSFGNEKQNQLNRKINNQSYTTENGQKNLETKIKVQEEHDAKRQANMDKFNQEVAKHEQND